MPNRTARVVNKSYVLPLVNLVSSYARYPYAITSAHHRELRRKHAEIARQRKVMVCKGCINDTKQSAPSHYHCIDATPDDFVTMRSPTERKNCDCQHRTGEKRGDNGGKTIVTG